MTGGYGSVLVDRPIQQEQHEFAGVVLSSTDKGEFAVADDPRFVVLSHPIETSILASTGYSWNDLLWQGRYVAVKNVICRKCGNVFQLRNLTAPGANGCFLALSIGVVVGSVTGISTHSYLLGFVAWYLATFGVMCIFGSLARWYIRSRFAARAALLAAERACPQCKSDDSIAIDRAKNVTCSRCKAVSLTFVDVGIS
jgi:hypothetical protein